MKEALLTAALLDVGQGDSTVLLLPIEADGLVRAIVIDCPSRRTATDEYLRRRGVVDIPFAVISHSDMDHFGGMVELLTNFVDRGGTIGRVAYHTDTVAIGQDNKRRLLARGLIDLIRRAATSYSPLRGQVWDLAPEVHIEVLHPEDLDVKDAQTTHRPNEASVVLRIVCAGMRLLLPADLGPAGWAQIRERGIEIAADFLRFPHHGAWYEPNATQPGLPEVIESISPRLAVFSVGSSNPHGHPHPSSVALLNSIPTIKFAHTQPTPRSRDGYGKPWPNQVSDSGTVEIHLGTDGYRVFILDSTGTVTEVTV
jgi:competence protein ComEC